MSIKLLSVFAHPDDEFPISGMLAKYVANGRQGVLAYTTRGEAGEISDPALASSDTLGSVREAEVRAACQVLGCHELHFLGYRDSGMVGTEANNDPRCYQQAEPEVVIEQLVALIRAVKPQVVITFEPNGWYGHPDHISASQHTTAAYNLAGDPTVFPNIGPPWQPDRLFYSVLPVQAFEAMRDQMAAYGLDTSDFDQFDTDHLKQVTEQVTHIVDVRGQIATKRTAWAHHQTQFGPDHPWRQSFQTAILETLFGYEHYIQVQPTLVHKADGPKLNDLLAGL